MNKAICVVAACVLLLGGGAAWAQGFHTISVSPTEDTFARAAEPFSTYGTAGLLSVAGQNAVNGSGLPNGAYDSWMKFDFAGVKDEFDAYYGEGFWFITSVSLEVYEFGEANNWRFNHGAGQFEVRYVADDDWSVGFGSPSNPGPATGNQIGFNYGRGLLDPAEDVSLGTFSNLAEPGSRSYDLAVTEEVWDTEAWAGDICTLYMVAADDAIGFNFYSENNGNPHLRITAVPEPSSLLLLLGGAFALLRRRG